MTQMLTDYRAVPDDDLAGLFASLEDTDAIVSVIAEMDRRERAGQRTAHARGTLAALRAEAAVHVEAQYRAASAACRGELLNERGKLYVADDHALWTLPGRDALRFCSVELAEFWQFTAPRITVDQYVKAQLRETRQARARAREAGRHDDPAERPGLADYEPGPLRRGAAAAAVPQGGRPGDVRGSGPAPAGAGDGREDGAADRRAGGPVRGGRDMTVTDVDRENRVGGYFARARAQVAADDRHDAVAVPQNTAVACTNRIDGARLLNIGDAWMGRHVWMSDAARHAAVLYVAAQHFRIAESGRLAWPRFGKYMLTADQPGTGKTTAMICMGHMSAPWFYGIDANPTAPGLCYSIAQENACLFIDEAHRLFGPKGTKKADVVTILNVSYEKNGCYLNGRGGKATRVKVYAAAVLAGRDTMLTAGGEELADLADRCAAIVHMRKPPGDAELTEVTDETQAQGEAIAAGLAAWAAQEMADPVRFREAFTTACGRAREIGLTGRAKDVWVPLMATAWLASAGHLDAACEAALEFRKNMPAQGEEDPLAGLEDMLAGAGEMPSWG